MRFDIQNMNHGLAWSKIKGIIQKDGLLQSFVFRRRQFPRPKDYSQINIALLLEMQGQLRSQSKDHTTAPQNFIFSIFLGSQRLTPNPIQRLSPKGADQRKTGGKGCREESLQYYFPPITNYYSKSKKINNQNFMWSWVLCWCRSRGGDFENPYWTHFHVDDSSNFTEQKWGPICNPTTKGTWASKQSMKFSRLNDTINNLQQWMRHLIIMQGAAGNIPMGGGPGCTQAMPID